MKTMKNLLLTGLFILAVMPASRAQYNGYDAPSTMFELKVGVGGPNWLGLTFRALPDGIQPGKGFVPFNASMNFYINPRFSLGLESNYLQAATDVYGIDITLQDSTLLKVNASTRIRRLGIALQGDYHFLDNERWDIFAGLLLGAKINRVTLNADYQGYDDIQQFFQDIGLNFNTLKLSPITPLVGVHAGARYSFTPNVGAYVDFGLGIPAANAGLSVRF